ncbi:MAG: universal stress protein [Deltaproteobacteria bacterium]|nr:MAG: universal stress protein [Deltaproteobacteria bacterium]
MQPRDQKKLLVAMDVSERSKNTVTQLARIDRFREYKIVLFHVFNPLQEIYWDLKIDPREFVSEKDMGAWESEKKNKTTDFMEQAQNILVDSGFNKNFLAVKIQPHLKGTARDFIAEARQGYQVVAIRRRGMLQDTSGIVGSVFSKLVEAISFVPLLIIGKHPFSGKIIMGIDGSENAMRAVDFVSGLLGGSDCRVHLISVVRGIQSFGQKQHQWQTLNKVIEPFIKRKLTASLEESKKRLTAAGFTSGQLSAKVITGDDSRAGCLVQEAERFGCDTIVLGRRGLSQVMDFSMGGVTRKVIQLAQDKSIWIIN